MKNLKIQNKRFDKTKNENAITLVALIITIIILIILVAITIKSLTHDGLVQLAAKATQYYKKGEGEELDLLNKIDYDLAVATNKIPRIEILKCSYTSGSPMVITVMATDGDNDNLTYRLYVGTAKENLVEQTDAKIDIRQGEEVTWMVPGDAEKYYYKIEVSDKYATVDSGTRETNNAPIIETVDMEKDIDEETGSWVKIRALATDAENDKLTYTLKMWKKINNTVNEAELITEEPTKENTIPNITAGENVEITINELEEYQDYIYCVEVTDGNNVTIGNVTLVKTYCSGAGLECLGKTLCGTCKGLRSSCR